MSSLSAPLPVEMALRCNDFHIAMTKRRFTALQGREIQEISKEEIKQVMQDIEAVKLGLQLCLNDLKEMGETLKAKELRKKISSSIEQVAELFQSVCALKKAWNIAKGNLV